MKHNKLINNRIKSLQGRSLRLIYCDHSSNFQELLQRDSSMTIYQKNIQALAILMYKVTKQHCIIYYIFRTALFFFKC